MPAPEPRAGAAEIRPADHHSRRRSRRTGRLGLAVLFAAATVVTVTAVVMAVAIRTTEEFGHTIGVVREWHVDAHACGAVAAAAILLWVCFVAAARRLIALNKRHTH